jgi:hypothetical protein
MRQWSMALIHRARNKKGPAVITLPALRFSPKTTRAISCAVRYYGGYGCRLDIVCGLNPTSSVRLEQRSELGVDNRVQYKFFYLIGIEFSSYDFFNLQTESFLSN